MSNAIDTMSNYCLIWDKDDRLILCNEKIFDLYPEARDIYVRGRPFEEALRMGFERGIFEAPKKMSLEQWLDQRIELHRLGVYFEVRQIGERWLQIRDQKTQDGDIVTTAIDITHLKKQEEETIRAKEQTEQAYNLLRDTLDTVSDGLSVWDKDDRFILANKKLFELYPNVKDIYAVPGHTYEEILRMGIERGDFTVPRGTTKEAWIKKRTALHKSGTYKGTRFVKGKWVQISDQCTAQGNIVTTAIDVFYLNAHAKKLMKTYKGNKLINDFQASEDCRDVTFKGEKFYLGEIQGKIIKLLYEAYVPGDEEKSYVDWKTLKSKAESNAERLRDAFGKKAVHKIMIRSDRGRHRLNLP